MAKFKKKLKKSIQSQKNKDKKKAPKKSNPKATPKKTAKATPDKKQPEKKRKVIYKRKHLLPKRKKRKKVYKVVDIIEGQKEKKSNYYNYIRSYLWRERKLEFEGGYCDNQFLEIVSFVNDKCKTSAKACPDSELLNLFDDYYSDLRQGKQPLEKPELPELLNVQPYWNVYNIAWDIFAVYPYLWVDATGIASLPSMFQISNYINKNTSLDAAYRKWFKGWVDWCNDVHYENGWHEDSDETVIHFCFESFEDGTGIKWDDENKRWYCKLYPCHDNGVYDDFGFEPSVTMETDDFTELPENIVEEKAKEIEEKREKVKEVQQQPAEAPKPIEEVEEKKKIDLKYYERERKINELNKEIEKEKADAKFWKEMDDTEQYKTSVARIMKLKANIDSLLNS